MCVLSLVHSNYEHLQHDLVAIHGLVCPLLAQARKPLPHANSSEERLEMKQQQQKTRVSDILCYEICGHLVTLLVMRNRI